MVKFQDRSINTSPIIYSRIRQYIEVTFGSNVFRGLRVVWFHRGLANRSATSPGKGFKKRTMEDFYNTKEQLV